MRKSLIALCAGASLVVPTAALVAPAEAGVYRAAAIKDCFKTQYGETVRIRIRDDGDTARIRVSHPRGKGNFRHPDVRRTFTGVLTFGDSAGGISRSPYGNDPSFRVESPAGMSTRVTTAFKLRNGKTIHMSCTKR